MLRRQTRATTFSILLAVSFLLQAASVTNAQVDPTYDFTTSTTVGGAPVPLEGRVWVPPGVDRLRGLLVQLPNMIGDARGKANLVDWQKAMGSLGFGIVGMNRVDDYGWGNDETAASVQTVLDAAAAASSHPELSNAPIVFAGRSNGAFKSSLLAAAIPSRAISFVSDKGGYGVGLSEEARHVPGLFVGGSQDGTVSPHFVNDGFRTWRGQNGQLAMSVDWGNGHGPTPIANVFSFISQTVKMRYPEGQMPSLIPGNPLAINRIETTDGWLGEAADFNHSPWPDYSLMSPWPEIAPYGSYTGDVNSASWLPNEVMAMVYRAHNAVDSAGNTSPLRVGAYHPAPPGLPFPLPDMIGPGYILMGESIEMAVDLGSLDAASVQEILVYDGSELIDVIEDPSQMNTLIYTPESEGIHTVIAVVRYVEDAETLQTSWYSTVVVQPIPEPASLCVLMIGATAIVRLRSRQVLRRKRR